MAGTKKEKRRISVFIASPGDLGPERERFREAIDKLNAGFGDGRRVTFEAQGWEDTLASSGKRSQSVINLEIDSCDVFILALNRRWGQDAPDSEYSSYTEEEFHRAMQRFEKSGSPEIFIFFKRVSPESEGDPGPELTKVMAFRESLEETRQFLYHYFHEPDSFEKEVDKHLRAYALDELPKLDAADGTTLLPLNAMQEIKAANQEAEDATQKAQSNYEQFQAANEKANLEAARASKFALQSAEDAAEYALDGKIEKARQRFAQAITGTTNLQIFSLAFNFYYRTGDLEAAVNIATRWQAATEPHSADRAAAYGNLGNVHQTRGELDEAVSMYEKALLLHEELGSKEGRAIQFGNLGNVHHIKGELDEAVLMYEKALLLNEELGSKEGMAIQFGNLGNVYQIRGEMDEAVAMCEKALLLHEELGSKEGMAIQFGNLGNVHQIKGELDEAVLMYEKALLLHEGLGSKEGMAIQFGNLGNVHQIKGELDAAVLMYEKALLLNEELGSKEGMAIQYGGLGNVHQIRGEQGEAVSMYEKALLLNEELGSKEGMAADYSNLGNVHQTRGELVKAREDWTAAFKLYDALSSPNAALVRKWLAELDD